MSGLNGAPADTAPCETVLEPKLLVLARSTLPARQRQRPDPMPSEASSGSKRRQGGLTKTGHSHVRRMWTECAWGYRFAARRDRVAVGIPVTRHPPHRSVRELQLIRLLPWMMATETPQRSLPTHARPPRHHRCPPLCADGARRNERSPWCRPFPPDSPPTISRLCSNPSRVLWPTPTPPPRTRGPYGLGLHPPAC